MSESMARSGNQVYLDMNALTQTHVTGIGKYCLELYNALKSCPESENGIFSLTPVIKLSRLRYRNRVQSRLHVRPRFSPFAFTGRDPIYHGLDFRAPRSKKFKKVVTVHDLISFEDVFNEKQFIVEAKRNFEAMLYKSAPDLFICVSEFTKRKFAEHYPKLAERARVIPLGCNHHIKLHEDDRASIVKKATLPERFILCLGTIEFRKNTIMAIKAFENLATRFPDVHLVVAGAKGFRGEEALQAMKLSTFRDRIHHLSYVSDSLVEALYQKAEVFLFPSLFEGFGLPILEAMKRGCPVVTSLASATEEVAGDACVLVDPRNEEAVTEGVVSLLTKSDLRQNLIELGWNRAQVFTWESVAHKTMNAYKDLIS